MRRIHVVSEIITKVHDWPRGHVPARAIVLENVHYIIEADLVATGSGVAEESATDVWNGLVRAAAQSAHDPPFLGHPEFSAVVSAEKWDAPLPQGHYAGSDIDLGWLPCDIPNARTARNGLFRARMTNGIIDVPSKQDPAIFV